MTMSAAERDDYENNLVAAGAVLALLHSTAYALDSLEAVVDANGNVTNQLEITLPFLASPYRITVERVTG